MDSGEWPTDNEAAGLSTNPTDITGKYVTQLAVSQGIISVTYGDEAHTLIDEDILVMSPVAQTGSVEWVCRSSTIADKHLPAACR
jgi:type IV pilus assembly protein PilA